MSEPTIEQIVERHTRASRDQILWGLCKTCLKVWPCDVARALEAWRQEKSERKRSEPVVIAAVNAVVSAHTCNSNCIYCEPLNEAVTAWVGVPPNGLGGATKQ